MNSKKGRLIFIIILLYLSNVSLNGIAENILKTEKKDKIESSTSKNSSADATKKLFNVFSVYSTKTSRDDFKSIHFEIIKYLAEGADINARDQKGNTPLMRSIKSDNQVIGIAEKVLLEQGANPNIANFDGYTALMFAVQKPDAPGVWLLLKYNADVNTSTKKGLTPLMIVSSIYNRFGKGVQDQFIENLLEKGADINAKDVNGDTALNFAVKAHNNYAIRLLLKNGADVKLAESSEGFKHLYYASWLEPDVVAELIKKGAEVNVITKENVWLPGASPLIYYANGNNIELVNLLLQNKADPNIKDSEKRAALYYAIERNNLEMCKLLLEYGADPNYRKPNDLTPLGIAVVNGRIDIAKKLLGEGADLDNLNMGETPLMLASSRGNLEMIDLLLNSGAKINYVNEQGSVTALSKAVQSDKEDVVSYLLSKGAEVNISCMGWAIIRGNIKLVAQFLKDGYNINKSDRDGRTLLILALQQKKKDVAVFLMEKGADINAAGAYGETPLSTAASLGYLDVITSLINRGVDVKNDCLALNAATASGYINIVQLLIDNGADVNLKGKHGNTALISAAEKGHVDIVKFLLDKGADINATVCTEGGECHPPECSTALMRASSGGYAEVVSILLEHGAGKQSRGGRFWGNEEIVRSFISAIEKGHAEVVKLFIDKIPDINAWITPQGYSPLTLAAREGHIDVMRVLLEKGADINAKDRNWGETALMHAASMDKSEAAFFLIEKGADIHLKDKDGKTVLMQAAGCGQTELVKLLLNKGLDVNERDSRGWTPLIHSMSLMSLYGSKAINARIETIKLLLQKGADVNAKDKSGSTALKTAKDFRLDSKIIKLLLEAGAKE